MDEYAHDAFQSQVYEEWQLSFAGPKHTPFCAVPAFISRDVGPTSWGPGARGADAARADAEQFMSAYAADAQFVFCRAQHHVHRKKDGFEPLSSCRHKRDKRRKICKTDFPKTKTLSDKQVV
eukprot:850341-Pyramimonas_sp.AAC.1